MHSYINNCFGIVMENEDLFPTTLILMGGEESRVAVMITMKMRKTNKKMMEIA
jgi:hypothetical protein